MIDILFKFPGDAPERIQIDNSPDKSLSELQRLVGGFVEALPIPGNCVLWIHESGTLEGLAPNLDLTEARNPFKIVGPVLITGSQPGQPGEGATIASLTPEQLDQYEGWLRARAI